eukprot:TRINITY_DN7583_c0_g1_i2.p1 TRINITY_DN7583_c0_g1~~TRINITY_DN7583_c0_g1_i2.p1  ORF type:complete len:126 (+),score=10.99 TRINITY_DN7583_c0_g1_i2:74-451(+)
MIRRPPRSTLSSSSAASDVYKRQPKAPPRRPNTTIELSRKPRPLPRALLRPNSSSPGKITQDVRSPHPRPHPPQLQQVRPLEVVSTSLSPLRDPICPWEDTPAKERELQSYCLRDDLAELWGSEC